LELAAEAFEPGFQGEIRYGPLRDVIRTYVNNNPTDQLLLGATIPTMLDYEERLAGLKEFAHQLQAEIGMLVDVIEVCPAKDENQKNQRVLTTQPSAFKID
jgi:hypothetical protein